MEFSILGTLELTSGGQPVDLRRAKPRAVLAVLVVQPNQIVSVDRLTTAIWGDDPPPSAANTLQGYVSYLRQVLANNACCDDPAVVRTRAPGYLLAVSPERVDARRFERLAADGRGALANEPERAAGLLGEALSLWRGPALAEFAEQPFALREAARLEELRLAALEDHADAKLALGCHNELAGRLYALVDQHPLRERLWGQLILALYRCGRQGEALRAFQDARRKLGDELGIEPSPALRHLERDILAQSDHLEWHPAPPFDCIDGAIRTQSITIASDPHEVADRPDSIPVQLTTFVGRRTELSAARKLLAGARTLTFTGSGGCGKTRLAIELALEVKRSGIRVWFVDLGSVSDAALMPIAVAHALGLDQGSGFDLAPLCDRIGTDHALLVLDNCEHVVAACARLVEAVLTRCPGLQVLATSREALLIRGETVWRVPSLSLVPTDRGSGNATRHRRSDATQLFLERGFSLLPGFNPGDAGLATVGRICQRLDGIPLAIELAAALIPILPLAEIARRLEQNFDLLTRGVRGAVPRQQTLQATIDWGYELLAPPERHLFARLSVFLGQFTVEAAEAVAPQNVGFMDALSALVAKSMLVPVVGPDGTWAYRLLNSLRHYGLRQLRASGFEADARRRHAAFFASFVEEADRELHGRDATDWSRRIVGELSNLQLALDWCFSSDGELELGVRLAGALRWWFFARMGQLAQAKKWLDVALERRHELDSSLQLKAMTAATSIAFSLGDYSRTAGIGEEAVALAEVLGDRAELATALMSRGGAAIYEGDLPRARECLARSLQYCQELNDRWGTAFVLGFSGAASRRAGETELARAQLEEALAIFRDLRDDHNQVAPMMQLALVAQRSGDLDEAMRLCDEAIGLARSLGDGQLAHGATCIAGRVELSRGNLVEAKRLLVVSLRSYPGAEHQLMVAIAVEGLAIVAHLEDRHFVSVELWGFAKHLRLVAAIPLSEERLIERRRHLDQAATRIGQDAVERALAAGASLSLNEVLIRADRPTET